MTRPLMRRHALLLLLTAAAPLSAQSRKLRVITPDNVSVPYAVVTIGSAQPQVADAEGFLALARLPAATHTMEVRRVGYVTFNGAVAVLDTASVTYVRVTPIPALVDRISFSAATGALSMEGFYQRLLKRQNGGNNGFFFTPEEVERRNAPDVSQLVRTISGVRLERAGDGGYVAVGSNNGTCQIGLATDGVLLRVPGDSRVGTAITPVMAGPGDTTRYAPPKDKGAIGTSDASLGRRSVVYADSNSVKLDRVVDIGAVMAIEVYPRSSMIPTELSTLDNNCGLVAIWTGTRK